MRDFINLFTHVLIGVLVLGAFLVAGYTLSAPLRGTESSENVTSESVGSVVMENIEHVDNLTVNNYSGYLSTEASQSLDPPADNIYALLSRVLVPCMVCVTIIVGIVIIYVIQRK